VVPIFLKVFALLLSLKTRSFNISSLWAPGHIGTSGNEHADYLAGSTTNQSYSSPQWCPYTDLVTLRLTSIQMLWRLEWDYPPTRVLCFWLYRLLFKSIPIQPWFQSLKISLTAIIKYTRLRTGNISGHRPQPATATTPLV